MTEPLVISGAIHIPFSYAAGAAASRFLTGLRDQRRILGTRCPRCERVLVPARSFCARCWSDTAEWVEVGPGGTLVEWTTVRVPLPHLPEGPPCTLGLIRLDGAGTDFLHRIGGDPRALARGMRLAPVWRARRTGSVLDLAHFLPAPPGGSDGLRDDQGPRS